MTHARAQKQLEALDQLIGMIESKQNTALLTDLPSHIHGYINSAKNQVYEAIRVYEKEVQP